MKFRESIRAMLDEDPPEERCAEFGCERAAPHVGVTHRRIVAERDPRTGLWMQCVHHWGHLDDETEPT